MLKRFGILTLVLTAGSLLQAAISPGQQQVYREQDHREEVRRDQLRFDGPYQLPGRHNFAVRDDRGYAFHTYDRVVVRPGWRDNRQFVPSCR